MTRAVEFIEVGRDKRSWTVTDFSKVRRDDFDADGFPSADWLAREAKRGGGLASNDVEVGIASETDDDSNLSVAVGGWRIVGKVRLVADAERRQKEDSR